MKLIAFSLLDVKTGIYNVPFFLAHPGQAVRACQELAADQRTTVARHPADFVLMRIGEFDDQLGEFAAGARESLGTVLSMIPAAAPPGPLFNGGEYAGGGEFLSGSN